MSLASLFSRPAALEGRLDARIPEDLLERLRTYAAENDVSVSAVARVALQEFFRRVELEQAGAARAERVVEAYQDDLATSLRNIVGITERRT